MWGIGTDIDKEILIRLSDGQGKTVLFKTAIVISQKIYLELPLLSQAPYYGVIVGSENTHKFKIIYQNWSSVKEFPRSKNRLCPA